jgi:hypothetical protein
MPIHKRDRSFQNIVREVEIEKIPVEYIQTLTLVLENGDRIIFDGEELNDIDEENILGFLVAVAEEISERYDSPVEDMEIIINYSRLEEEIKSLTQEILSSKDKNDSSDPST